MQGDKGLIPGSGRSPGRGNGNPLQCSCLKNSIDRGAWWTTVHRVAKYWTRLSYWACACTMNVMSSSHLKTTTTPSLDPWKNCLPRNWSWVPRRLGTTGWDHWFWPSSTSEQTLCWGHQEITVCFDCHSAIVPWWYHIHDQTSWAGDWLTETWDIAGSLETIPSQPSNPPSSDL